VYARLVFRDCRSGLAAEARKFSLYSQQARAAFGAALAVVAAVLVSDWLNLEQAYWAGISALVVSRTTYAASLAKGALRIVGTFFGCLLALILVGWCADNTFALLCLVFFFGSGVVIVASTRGKDVYAWFMCGFMVALVSISALNDPNGTFDFAFYRTFEITVGSVSAIVMSAIVNPASSSEAAAAALSRVFANLAEAVSLLGKGWAEGALDEERIASVRDRVKSELRSLHALVYEGRMEGGFNSEQTALAARLCRGADDFSMRLFLLLGQRTALLQGYAGLFRPEMDRLAAALDEAARAVEAALRKPQVSDEIVLASGELRGAVHGLLDRHQSFLDLGRNQGRSGDEMLAWSEFLALVSALAESFGADSANEARSEKGQKKVVLESMVVRQAVSAGLSMVLVPLIWKWCDFPGAVQLAVTAMIVLQPDPVETWRKGFLRLSGGIVGGSIGLLLLGTPVGHEFTLWIVVYFALLFLFSYLDHGDSRCSYIGLQGGMALTLTLVQGLGPAESLEPPIVRVCGILAGVLLMNVIYTLLGGYSPMQDLKGHLQGMLAGLGRAVPALDEEERKAACAEAKAHFKAAARAQDLLVGQAGVKLEDAVLLQAFLADARRAVNEAPQAMAPAMDPDARVLLSDTELRIPKLLHKTGEALRQAGTKSGVPWAEVCGMLKNVQEDFAADVALLRRNVKARASSRKTRMEVAAFAMALKGLLEALADMAGRGERIRDFLK
jgi:uncharacterized membrane protein YccC